MTTQGAVTSYGVMGDGVTLTFEKSADWDAGDGQRGFAANITVINATGSAMEMLSLHFDFPANVTQMWNATWSRSNTQLVVMPEGWNRHLGHDQSRSSGFSGTYSEVFEEPTAFILSGVAVSDQAPLEPTIPDCRLDRRIVVVADWPTEGNSRGFVAEVYITNTLSRPIHWSLRINTQAEITQMWNASLARNEDSYDVTPTAENTRIEPSQVGSFGFQGTYSGELGEIAVSICPDDSRYYFDYIVWWQSEVYASLSEEGKARVASGDLVWNGYGYSLRPTILMPNRPGQDPSLPPDQDP